MSTFDNNGIKVRIKFLLNERQITAYKMAEDMRIHDTTLYKFLNDKTTCSLSLATLAKISKYFDVNLFWLINGFSVPRRKNNNEDV